MVATGLLLAVGVAGPAGASSDPAFDRQWGLVKIGAPTAWATTTGAGIRIGIVDSGIHLAHEDLQGGKIVAATACIDTRGDSRRCTGSGQDIDGHGTHVAGIAAAVKDNGRGVAGVAPDSQLLVARVFDGDTATTDDILAGIKWTVDNGARVVNLSLGDILPVQGELGGGDDSFAEGVEYAWSRGAVAVLAAGNTNLLGFGSANYGGANAVVVGATGRSDEISSYSSETGNAKWALVAPGGNRSRGGETAEIFSTYWKAGGPNNLYGYLQGTSMAAPHVSGALALLMSRPGVNNQRAVEILLASADRNVKCGPNSANCAGRLDVAKAIAMAGGASPAPEPAASTTAPPPPAPSGGQTATTARRASRPPPAPPPNQPGAPVTPEPPPAPVTEDAPTPTTAVEAEPDRLFTIGPEGRVETHGDEPSETALPIGVGATALVAVAAWLVTMQRKRRFSSARTSSGAAP